MKDILGMVADLSRPKLLVQAARFGLEDYRRDSRLPRLLQQERVPGPGAATMALLALEGRLNDERIAKSAEYSVARHVDVLIALMGETQLLRASSKQLRAVT